MVQNLVKDFEESLFPASEDILIELSDSTVGELCKNEIVSKIPILKTLSSFLKFGAAIYESHLLNQTLTFLQTFNSKTISKKETSEI